MEKFSVTARNGEEDSTITIVEWADAVEVTQDGDTVWMQDARQVRKTIKAIRKAAKRLGWEV